VRRDIPKSHFVKTVLQFLAITVMCQTIIKRNVAVVGSEIHVSSAKEDVFAFATYFLFS
jgi:hypothetical protein